MVSQDSRPSHQSDLCGGYLYVGHAKPAILNDHFAHDAFDGKLIVRFDDTNPAKEKQGFDEAILHDLDLLGIKPDQTTYTSDYFSRLYGIAEKMIRDGHAYADDNEPEAIIAERRQGLPSKRRDRPCEESLAMFNEMYTGTPLGGKHCIRARIKFDSINLTLREPIINRFHGQKNMQSNLLESSIIPHERTGLTWRIYPTYDFACPVVDSIEGVTHALRASDYAERNEQYAWFLNTLGLRQVHLWSFARTSFT
ncbi:hypothetical protein KVR01_013328 [Diaporthe batatas]|uniref:uncharacterized protein n=1 Tax=Diaporthe batatas TaxID=748121 RepID=UPI001D05C148|nr:uncharacterized protein KVR01_013328 [Diaporthe batatas]KAG8156723.1 hypothetical protein KVR01_013328 [Diaporthe batatas]